MEKLAVDLLDLHFGNRVLAQHHWMKWVQKCQELQAILERPRREQLKKAEECAWVTFVATIDLRGECLVCAGVSQEVIAVMDRWLNDA
ncbi:hypothetical protein ACPCTN_03245 [Streptomyces cinereoruber]|uniref:hypothetical protein n=1 Tax=Streptomyces cinereoruber TaxID=67260 RepID=UPI003C30B9ED